MERNLLITENSPSLAVPLWADLAVFIIVVIIVVV